MATRKLRITIEWPWSGVSDDVEDYDLPDGWDEMTPDQQQLLISKYVETIVWNVVSGSGEVIEADR